VEVYKLEGHHVMTGRQVKMTFLVVRRRNKRPIDMILDKFDLGGIHVTKVTKMQPRKAGAYLLETNIQVVGRR
jgi:hypothetical protein